MSMTSTIILTRKSLIFLPYTRSHIQTVRPVYILLKTVIFCGIQQGNALFMMLKAALLSSLYHLSQPRDGVHCPSCQITCASFKGNII